jgi:hypothetical protein
MNNEEINERLKNIENYLEILVRFNHAQIKQHAFLNEVEEKIFELTGVKGRDEICTELRVSSKTISELWKRWLEVGLLIKQGNSYKKTVE